MSLQTKLTAVVLPKLTAIVSFPHALQFLGVCEGVIFSKSCCAAPTGRHHIARGVSPENERTNRIILFEPQRGDIV